MFEIKPAPHNMDKPEDSEDFTFERELNERKLVILSDKMVATWKELKELVDSSPIAKEAFRETWKREVGHYINSSSGLELYSLSPSQLCFNLREEIIKDMKNWLCHFIVHRI